MFLIKTPRGKCLESTVTKTLYTVNFLPKIFKIFQPMSEIRGAEELCIINTPNHAYIPNSVSYPSSPHIMDAYGLIIIEFIKINYSVIIKMIFLQIFTPCLEN